MKRKILAILTTACLVLTMFPVAAFAHSIGDDSLQTGVAGWSDNWGDNCLNVESDNWYLTDKQGYVGTVSGSGNWTGTYSDSIFEHPYADGGIAVSGSITGTVNFDTAVIKSHLYGDKGIRVTNAEDALKKIMELSANPISESDYVSYVYSKKGEYFDGSRHNWHHHCSPEAKVTYNQVVVFFHDADNALLYANTHGGILTLSGGAFFDGKVNGRQPAGDISNEKKLIISKKITIECPAETPVFTDDYEVIVKDELTIKPSEVSESGTADSVALKNVKVDKDATLVVESGVQIAASDNWAIEAGEGANVTINGTLDADNNGIKAAKNSTIIINGILRAKWKEAVTVSQGESAEVPVKGAGIVASGSKITVGKGGLINAVGVGISADDSTITVVGGIDAGAGGIDAEDCIVNIAGESGSDAWVQTTGSASWAVNLEGASKLTTNEKSGISGKPTANGLQISGNSKAYLKGKVFGLTGVYQHGEKSSVLEIKSGVVAGKENAINVEGGTFNINAEAKTVVKSKEGIAIVLKNNGNVVPSITATSDAWLKVKAPNGKDAVSVNPSDSWFWGGFISAGKYSKDVKNKYIKQGYQDVPVGDSSTWVKVVPCQTITSKNVSLDTYVVNYANDKTKKPNVTVTINGQSVQLDGNFEVNYEGDKQVGKAKVTVTAKSDKYKGTVVKYYYVKGPVTPSSITAPGAAGQCTVYVVGNYFVYNGQKIRPMVVVKNGAFTVNPTEYQVEYFKNTGVGKAEVKVTSYAQKTVTAQGAEIKPAFEGTANFTILPRNLYVIPDSYTKTLSSKSDSWLTLTSKAYGYVPKDADDVSTYCNNLKYSVTRGKTVVDLDDNNNKINLGKNGKLSSGVYQIAIDSGVVADEERSPEKLDNYKVIPATGKLIVLDANGKAPVVDVKTTGNSLVDMINNAIKTATEKIAVEIKVDVDVPIINQLEKAVEKAQNLWKKLVPNKVY